MFSVNDSLFKKEEEEEKKEPIMTVVPNHRKDVDKCLLLILDLSGKVLATLHV